MREKGGKMVKQECGLKRSEAERGKMKGGPMEEEVVWIRVQQNRGEKREQERSGEKGKNKEEKN